MTTFTRKLRVGLKYNWEKNLIMSCVKWCIVGQSLTSTNHEVRTSSSDHLYLTTYYLVLLEFAQASEPALEIIKTN